MTPRLILVGIALLLLSGLAGSAAWFRARLPPGCADPRTVALVQQTLASRDHLPASATLTAIHTVAGGFVALRFVCRAQLTGFDPKALPEGMPLPGTVNYTSRLTPDGRLLQVSVTLQPLLIWEKVQ